MATIQEVAKLANVSVATAYKVFSDTYTTEAQNTQRVLQAAKILGYVPKKKERHPSRDYKLIALLFSEASNEFNTSLIRTLTKKFSHFQFRVVVMYSNENDETEAQNFRMALDLDVDAVIYATVSGKRHEYADKLIERGIPIVQLFAPVYPQLNTIVFDDALGTYLATKALLQTGHRRILMLYRSRDCMPRREPGYIKAFEEFNVPVDARFLFHLDLESSIKLILKKKIDELKPTAIISVNEPISIETIQVLKEAKMNVPEDISLIIYDDLSWAAASGYTTVAHPFDQVGTVCRNLILSMMQKKGNSQAEQAPAKLVIEPMVILRDSVKSVKN